MRISGKPSAELASTESALTASRSLAHSHGKALAYGVQFSLRRKSSTMKALLCLLLVGVGACASAPSQTRQSPTPRDTTKSELGLGATSVPNADPFPSTYIPFPSRTTVIRNVNILTAAGPLIRNGAILMQNGKIAAVGATVNAPADALVIDGAGKYVTPGIIRSEE